MTAMMTGGEVTLIEGTSAISTQTSNHAASPPDLTEEVARYLRVSPNDLRALIAAQSEQTGVSIVDRWRRRAAQAPHAGLEPTDDDEMASTMHAAFLVQQVVVERLDSENES